MNRPYRAKIWPDAWQFRERPPFLMEARTLQEQAWFPSLFPTPNSMSKRGQNRRRA